MTTVAAPAVPVAPAAPAVPVVPAAPAVPAVHTDFRVLATQVRDARLLERRLGYYAIKSFLTIGAFAAAWAAFFAVGDSWATLGIAALLGLLGTQLGFLGHDAGHRQVFSSPRSNRLLGLLCGNALIGLSFGWWIPKHNAHHAHPNEVDRDPDIGAGIVRLPETDGQGGARPSLGWWLARWQAELFFPLMLLRSTGLYVSGVQDLVRRRGRGVVVEAVLLALHGALYLTAVFWVLRPLQAAAFIVVHQAVFSVYLGCSFAPNHKGMPLLEGDCQMGFAERQVVTSRNIAGGLWTGFVLGGLNYQIEHHLFPAMPRPNLRRARGLVRAYCAENNLGYNEDTPIGACRQAMNQLRLAGKASSGRAVD